MGAPQAQVSGLRNPFEVNFFAASSWVFDAPMAAVSSVKTSETSSSAPVVLNWSRTWLLPPTASTPRFANAWRSPQQLWDDVPRRVMSA